MVRISRRFGRPWYWGLSPTIWGLCQDFGRGSRRATLGNPTTAPGRTWGHVPASGHSRGQRTTNSSYKGKRCAGSVSSRIREGGGARPRAHVASELRPCLGSSPDVGSNRGETRVRPVGYLPQQGCACGLPRRAPFLAEQARAYRGVGGWRACGW